LGDYISIYDIARAVEDGATVPIYSESRLAKLELSEAERPKVDPDRISGGRASAERLPSAKPALVFAGLICP
jgi:type I site-specific restriction-modification system R (restriction) subunit